MFSEVLSLKGVKLSNFSPCPVLYTKQWTDQINAKIINDLQKLRSIKEFLIFLSAHPQPVIYIKHKI